MYRNGEAQVTKPKQTSGCKRQLALTTKNLRAISSEGSCNTAACSQSSPTQDVQRCLVCKEEGCKKEPHTVVRTVSLEQWFHHMFSVSGKLTNFILVSVRLDGGVCLSEESCQNEGTKHPFVHSSHQTAIPMAHLGHQRFCCLTAGGLQCKWRSSGCYCRTVSLLASGIKNSLPPWLFGLFQIHIPVQRLQGWGINASLKGFDKKLFSFGGKCFTNVGWMSQFAVEVPSQVHTMEPFYTLWSVQMSRQTPAWQHHQLPWCLGPVGRLCSGTLPSSLSIWFEPVTLTPLPFCHFLPS